MKNPSKKPRIVTGEVYSDAQLEVFAKDATKLCEEFGTGYDPLGVCRQCTGLATLCHVVKARNIRKKELEFTQSQYFSEYYLDEYLQKVYSPALREMQDFYAASIASKGGEEISFDRFQEIVSHPDNELNYKTFMRTHDEKFPLMLFYSMAQYEGITVDYENLTVRYEG